MSKNKIADSIIIRVGGGIREVPRETAENLESLEAATQENRLEQTDDMHPFGVDIGANTKFGLNKIIN